MILNKKKSVKLNYFFNIIYQVFLLIVPLVVTPYISRVLGPDGVGQFSFSYSLITYFVIFGSLGFGYYAQREMAKFQGDKYRQTVIFWEIIVCRLFPVLFSLTVNICFCFSGLYKEYTSFMLIFSINIFSIIFDISFLFQGNEQFGKLVFFNILIKFLSILAIFIFVNDSDDLWIYCLINGALVLVSNLVIWIGLYKILVKIKFSEIKPMRHLKGTLRLFIPTIATSIYTVLDRTLVGVLITETYISYEDGIELIKRYSDLENGYYEQSEKIVKIVLTVITALGTVMIPRNTKEFVNGNIEEIKNNIYKSSNIVWFIGVPMTLGLICVSNNFVPWFFGESFEKCIYLIMIFSPLVLILGFSNIFGLQYLIPTGQDRKFTIALLTGGLINLILNCIMIPFFWSFGAAIASIVAEFIVTLIMILFVRKDISIKKIGLMSWKYIVSGAIMFIVTYFVQSLLSSSIINTFLIVLIGISIYLILLMILRDQFLFNIFLYLKNKFKKGETNV